VHQIQNYFCLPDSSFSSSFFQNVLEIALSSYTYTILLLESYIIWNWHKFFRPIGRSWRKKKNWPAKSDGKRRLSSKGSWRRWCTSCERSQLNFNLTALQSILPPRCSIPSSWTSSRHHCHFSRSIAVSQNPNHSWALWTFLFQLRTIELGFPSKLGFYIKFRAIKFFFVGISPLIPYPKVSFVIK
jgi:hypothetical protein